MRLQEDFIPGSEGKTFGFYAGVVLAVLTVGVLIFFASKIDFTKKNYRNSDAVRVPQEQNNETMALKLMTVEEVQKEIRRAEEKNLPKPKLLTPEEARKEIDKTEKENQFGIKLLNAEEAEKEIEMVKNPSM